MIAVAAAVIALAAVIVVVLLTSKKAVAPADDWAEQGFTLKEEFVFNERENYYFQNRMAVYDAAITARETVGEEDQDVIFAYATDADLIGDLAAAREAYEKYFQINPIDYVAFENYSDVTERMGDLKTAEDAIRQALNLAATDDTFGRYIRFLENHFAGQRDDEIIATYELSVSILGQKAWNMTGLGDAYFRTGDCTQAIAHYQVALQLAPDDEGLKKDFQKLKDSCK